MGFEEAKRIMYVYYGIFNYVSWNLFQQLYRPTNKRVSFPIFGTNIVPGKEIAK